VRAHVLEVLEQGARDSALDPDLVDSTHPASVTHSRGSDVTQLG
jgi:hypothetical protein